MADHRVVTTDAEIDAGLEQAKALEGEPFAQSVEHDQRLNVLVVRLSNGRRLVLPVEELQGLESATHKQLLTYELVGGGTGISWPGLDADLYVPSLIEGRYGTKRWMAELGRKGGGATSDAKQQASRANGAKGGRPKKSAGFDEAATFMYVDTRPKPKVAAKGRPKGRVIPAGAFRTKNVTGGRTPMNIPPGALWKKR